MRFTRLAFCVFLIATVGCSAEEHPDQPGSAGDEAAGQAASGTGGGNAGGEGGSSQTLPMSGTNGHAGTARGMTDAAAGGHAAADAGLATDAGDASMQADAAPPPPADALFNLPPITTARLETLVTPAVLGISENGVFIDDGRFFVAGGEGIYEIVGGPDTYSAVLFAPSPGCAFGGITARGARLYAPCTNTDTFTGELIVFEPAREQPLVSRAPIVTQSSAHFNGMAFGPDGALYLSNSLAVDSPDPAVVRLEILDEEPLMFTQTPFIAAGVSDGPENIGGGSFPNGVRFHGNTMYYVRGVDVVAVPIGLDDPSAPLEVAYAADSLSTIDDFDIGDERMWLAQFSSLRALGLPGDSKLVVTDLEGDVEFDLDLPFVASSSIVAVDTLFGPASIILTSYFDGGLYRVTFE